MTEGQWIWMMVHMALDNEEKMDKTCDKCKSHMDEHRCVQCGEKLLEKVGINPNFDEDLFNRLKSNI